MGCKANRLERFKKANISVIEMNDEEDGHETTSFIIEGKTCVYYRNKSLRDMMVEKYSDEDMLQFIKKQLWIPYHVILFMRSVDTLDDLKLRLSELENQKIKPNVVTVVDCLHNNIDSLSLESPSQMRHIENFFVRRQGSQVMKACQEHAFNHWRLQTIQDISKTDADIVDLVYDSTKDMNYLFYISLECSHSIPSTLSEEIHASIHDDMKTFSVLLPNNNNIGRGALKIAHKKHAGNSFGIALDEKIKFYDDSPQLIKKVEEICPSLQTS